MPITSEDIQKIIDEFKRIFPTKEDLKQALNKQKTEISAEVAEVLRESFYANDKIYGSREEIELLKKEVEELKQVVSSKL